MFTTNESVHYNTLLRNRSVSAYYQFILYIFGLLLIFHLPCLTAWEGEDYNYNYSPTVREEEGVLREKFRAPLKKTMTDEASPLPRTTTTATKLVIATRLHLGRASSPPTDDKLTEILTNFYRFVVSINNGNNNTDDDNKSSSTCSSTSTYSVYPVIAVDSTPKIEGYDYVKAIQDKITEIEQSYRQKQQADGAATTYNSIHVLPVTPWGKFVPALNALILYASEDVTADLILFVSAEVTASPSTISTLCNHVMEDYDHTLVVGAAMNGHIYHQSSSAEAAVATSSSGDCTEVGLNGRTCPWNTLAVWNVQKLKLTGFVLCSDLGSSAGVEECAAIGIQQKLFGKTNTIAKLVKLNEINWEESFDFDQERQKWHEQKMNSKLQRANTQFQLLNFNTTTAGDGSVIHC